MSNYWNISKYSSIHPDNLDDDDIVKLICDVLPHGSGINGEWYIRELKNGKIVFSNSYHAMNQWGCYVTWVSFSFIVDLSDIDNFRLVFHEKYRYWIDRLDLKNYLETLFCECLSELPQNNYKGQLIAL
jgi:hypothetical protein